MTSPHPRSYNRTDREARPIEFISNVNRYAEGSCLVKFGNTHVLCTASVEEEIPKWLKEKNQGWITAEYSMLPRATHTRSKRDREKISGRTHEIQRLIARSLRNCVELADLGPRQITIDCDVIQADGGTRTAAISGGCVALALAIQKLENEKKVKAGIFRHFVAAISVGFCDERVLVDLDYDEDSTCAVDFNIVRLDNGEFSEVQGTAEKGTFSKGALDAMLSASDATFDQLFKKMKGLILSGRDNQT